MSETQASLGQNRTVVILLGVIVVLLAAIAIIFVVNAGKGDNTQTASTDATADAASMGGVAPADVPFDATSATKVVAGTTPAEHVEAYFQAIVAGDYDAAYALLPADKKAAQDAASFAEQLASYGFSGYEMGASVESGDEMTVEATGITSGGEFGYIWTFVKDGGEWFVRTRELAGMGG